MTLVILDDTKKYKNKSELKNKRKKEKASDSLCLSRLYYAFHVCPFLMQMLYL